MVDLDSEDSLLYNYNWAFLLMLIFWTADVIVVSTLDVPDQKVTSQNPWMLIGGLLTSGRTLVFLLWCILVGFGFGSMGFKTWLLEDLAGENTCSVAKNLKFLQGLCLTFNCLGRNSQEGYLGVVTMSTYSNLDTAVLF